MEQEYISAEELALYFRSKEDLYKLLTIDSKCWHNQTHIENLYLLKIQNCSLEFMRQLFEGNKLAFNKTQVFSLIMPRYKELTVSKIWEQVKDIFEINRYFPYFKENELPDRDFLVTIICTINPDAVKQLVAEARKNRSVNTSENNNDLIKITPAIKEAILNTNPQRTTRGMANYLLKSKAKLRRERRKPKEFEADLQLLKNIRRNRDDLSDQEDQNNDLESDKAGQEEEKKTLDMD